MSRNCTSAVELVFAPDPEQAVTSTAAIAPAITTIDRRKSLLRHLDTANLLNEYVCDP
jgi:hypothetical protein